jgi:Arc/MetJ family transcription regulator
MLLRDEMICILDTSCTHRGAIMRTNIDIDDALMKKALRVTGLKTKRAVVEEGLRLLIRLKEQEEILSLAGKVRWEGDLEESRVGRNTR